MKVDAKRGSVALAVVLVCAASSVSWAQPDVETSTAAIQRKAGCTTVFYPSEAGETFAHTDKHQVPKPSTGGRTGGLIGGVNRVTAMMMGADGKEHSRQEFEGAGYQSTSQGDKEILVKDFTVRRQASAKVCIRAGKLLGGGKIALEAKAFAKEKGPNITSEYPDDVRALASAETDAKVKAERVEFEKRAKAAIESLLADLRKMTPQLTADEMMTLFDSTGTKKTVPFRFSGQEYSATIAVRIKDE